MDGLRSAIDYFRSTNDRLGEVQAHLTLGTTLPVSEILRVAWKILSRADEGAGLLRDAEIQAQIKFHKARAEWMLRQHDKATSDFKQALSLAEDVDNLATQGRALPELVLRLIENPPAPACVANNHRAASKLAR